jgi:hypothetical protein
MMRFVFLLASLPFVACAPMGYYRTASAGQTGCAPREIAISNVDPGMTYASWQAQCMNETFMCSAVATGKDSQVACKKRVVAVAPQRPGVVPAKAVRAK